MLYAEMTRTELLDCFPKNGNICEVGVFGCDFSRKILSIINPKELHLIDIWKWKYFDWDSPSEENKHKKEHFIKWATLHFPDYQGDHPDTLLENFFQIALNIQKEAKNTIIKVHRGESLVMGSLLPDKYFDAIYIDADHHYDSVLNNLFLIKNISNHSLCYGKYAF